MSVDNTGADIPAIQGTEQPQQQETGGNPAWQELYDVMPSNLHPQIKPVLEKWEQGTQQKFQEYSERDKRYEPYKDFIENDIPADRIAEALQLAQLIDTDPRGLLEQMQAFFGEDNGQQQQPQGQEGDPDFTPTFEDQPFDLEQDPRFQQLAQQQDVIANFLSQQAQAELAAEADSALEQELTQLREANGEFDERYVLTLAASGMELGDAVKQYQSLVEGIRSRPAPDANMPTVIGGGGVPSEAPDMGNLSEQDRKSLVMNILKQASENQG